MQSKLNLLFITYTHSNGGGAENVLTTLVNNLSPEKYNITIQEIDAYNVKQEPINSNVILRERPLRKSYKHFDFFAATNFFFLYYNPKVLKSIFDWNGFDVVISWNYQLPSFALLGFDEEYKISHFHASIEDLDLKKYPNRKKDFERQLKTWKYADKISTISNYSKKTAIDIYPQFENKIFIIHNGTNIKEIEQKSILSSKEDFHFKSEKSVKLISMGRLEKNKNNILVLEALNILNKKNIDFEYIILGKGNVEQELKNKVIEFGLEDKVHFLGFVKNNYHYLNESDILCFSSFIEGWGMVVAESMVLGKPFVTTPVAGASDELLNNGKCGLVADFTPEDYAEKLEKLIKDKKLRNQLGENGKNHVKNFSIECYIREFETLISDAKKLEHKSLAFYNLKNKLIYCVVFALGIADPVFDLQAMSKHLSCFFRQKKINSIVKCGYRFVHFLLSIIAIPVLCIPRLVAGICYCATNSLGEKNINIGKMEVAAEKNR